MNLKRYKYSLFFGLSLLGTAQHLFAEVLSPHFENDAIVQPKRPEIQTPPSLGPSSEDVLQEQGEESGDRRNKKDLLKLAPTQKLPEKILVKDLLSHPQLTEQLIGQFIVTKNWDSLEEILPVYTQIPSHDPILVNYAKGALYRQQGKHTLAIRAYRAIIAEQPDLVYIRFDLAVMLFENKEYEAAEDQFQKVRASTGLNESLQALCQQYLKSTQEKIGWRYNAGMNYSYDDNVNNSSRIKEIKVGDLTFQKDEDSLPKSANGISYNLGASRDINIQGEHYLSINASMYGVEYWDEKDYSDRTLRIAAGYKKQNIQSWFSITPFFEDMWLGDHQYGTNVGISTEYGRWVSNKWQVMANHAFAHKVYDDSDLKRYEGNLNALSFTGAYFSSPTLILIGGVDSQWDHLNAKDQSSKKYGVRLGLIKEFNNGISGQVNLRYAKRNFDAPHFFYNDVIRKDHEYQVGLTVWHRNLHWRGITPKINYRYLKIDSNLPAFYSRDSHQWFLSFDKTF